jgi:hypothetical protein
MSEPTRSPQSPARQDRFKEEAAEYAVTYIQSGMTVGSRYRQHCDLCYPAYRRTVLRHRGAELLISEAAEKLDVAIGDLEYRLVG